MVRTRRARSRRAWSTVAVALVVGSIASTLSPVPASAATLPGIEIIEDRESYGYLRGADFASLVVALADGTAAAMVRDTDAPHVSVRSTTGVWTSPVLSPGGTGQVLATAIDVVGDDRVLAAWIRGAGSTWDVWGSVVVPSTGEASAPVRLDTGIPATTQLSVAGGPNGTGIVVYPKTATALGSVTWGPTPSGFSAPAVLPFNAPVGFARFRAGWIGGGRYVTLAHWRSTNSGAVSSRQEVLSATVLEPGALSWNAPIVGFDTVTSGSSLNLQFGSWGGGTFPGAVAAWPRFVSSSSNPLYARTFNAATASWSAETEISPNTSDFRLSSSSTASSVTAAMLEYQGGNFDFPAVVARGFDGQSWAAPQTVAPSLAQRQTPYVEVAADGTAVVSWFSGSGTPGAYAAIRNGASGTWSGGTEVVATGLYAGVGVWRANTWLIGWVDATARRPVARSFGTVVVPKPIPRLALAVDDANPRRVLADASASTHESEARRLVEYRWSWDGQARTTTTPTATLDFRQGGVRSVTLTLTDDVGETADVTQEITLERADGLEATVAVDRPSVDQPETAAGPEPVNAEVTVTLKNVSDQDIRSIRLNELRVDRTAPLQPLAVTQTAGVETGDEGFLVGTLAPGETRELRATFTATDDAEVEFSALASGTGADGTNELGVGRVRWSVKPKYLVRLRSQVDRPQAGELLPAGDTIRISGTVRNMSNSATLDLGPLYPTLTGNAGVSSLTYDTVGLDPRSLTPTTAPQLGPGEEVDFTVRVLTSASDPRRIDGDGATGGVRATVTFTPYGRATLVDETVHDILPAEILAAPEDTTHRVSIDDSITVPAFDPAAFAGAILVGGVEGVWNAAVSVVLGAVALVKLPFTVLSATSEYQGQVWSSFTDAEKEAFVNDSAAMAVAVLRRNAEFGRRDAAELFQAVQASTLQSMIDMENDWRVGDYTSTTRLYTRFGADAIAQVAVPTAIGKLAKSPLAVAALQRAQAAVQARMAPLLGDLGRLERIEELGPVLSALESGVELLPEQLATLYGITPDELLELQKLATKYRFLLTVRSRHASSIEWIERFGALLKPETLKIKSVSELDTKLGYRPSDLGSLVFRKPEALARFDAGEGDLGALIIDFVRSKGIPEGTGDFENAVRRVADRAVEWRKWEKYYKRWSDRGWIDVSFNYKGNAISDPLRRGPSGLDIAPLETGKYAGFRLRSIGTEEYVVEMLDGRTGRFVPVTGDIDPIAFTHLDGSPLTAAEHADLLDDMRVNALLGARHGESATFVKGGVDFVVSQFKPNEPGLQIAPGGLAPRVVRLNPGKSRWENPFDYHLHWDGGFVYSGTYIPRTARPLPTLVAPPATLPPAARPRPLPRATTPGPNVGRCRVTYSTAPSSVALLFDDAERIVELRDGALQPSPLDTTCFAPGDEVALEVKPMTGADADVAAGATRIPVPTTEVLAAANDGLAVGDEVTVGAGTDHAETATITGFGSILLDRPLRFDHAAGELVIVTKPAPDGPGTTTTTSTTTSTTSTTTSTSTTTVPITSTTSTTTPDPDPKPTTTVPPKPTTTTVPKPTTATTPTKPTTTTTVPPQPPADPPTCDLDEAVLARTRRGTTVRLRIGPASTRVRGGVQVWSGGRLLGGRLVRVEDGKGLTFSVPLPTSARRRWDLRVRIVVIDAAGRRTETWERVTLRVGSR